MIKKILALLIIFTTIFIAKETYAAQVQVSAIPVGAKIVYGGKAWRMVTPSEGLIVSDSLVDRKAFDEDNTNVYNPSDSNNIGFWLNNTLYNDFSTEDKVNIKNSTWYTGNSAAETASNVTAHVGLLRQSEYLASRGTVFETTGTKSRWWLITPSSVNVNEVMNVGIDGATPDTPASNSFGVRPAIRIDETSSLEYDTYAEVYYAGVAGATKSLSQLNLGNIIAFNNDFYRVVNSSEGLVVRNSNLIRRQFDADNTNSYNPVDANNIGFYLNNDFFNTFSADEKQLIKVSTWNDGNELDEAVSTIDARMGLITNSEYINSKGIIFPRDGEHADFWLGTTSSANATDVATVISDGTISYETANQNYALRPAFRFEAGVLFTNIGNDVVIVKQNQVPTISFLTPAENDSFPKNTNLNLSYNSLDTDGTIIGYEYKIGTTSGGDELVTITSMGTNKTATINLSTISNPAWDGSDTGTFYVSIRAKDNLNAYSTFETRAYSWEKELLPPTTPGAFTGTPATASLGGNVDLTWGASTDPNSDAISYNIESAYYDGSAWSAWSVVKSTAATSTTVVASSNAAYSEAKFRVRASDGVLGSAYIETTSITLTKAGLGIEVKDLNVGEYINFGRYHGADIKWRIINKRDIDGDGEDEVMLISDKIIDFKEFDDPENGLSGSATSSFPKIDDAREQYGSNDWETSNIREWLNSEAKVNWLTDTPSYKDENGFLYNFTETEKSIIMPSLHKNVLATPEVGTQEGGSALYALGGFDAASILGNYESAYFRNVTDRVFLLSIKENLDYIYNNATLGNGETYYSGKPTPESLKVASAPAITINDNYYNWLRTNSNSNGSVIRTWFSGSEFVQASIRFIRY